jgi:hypothetical protein
MDEIASIRTDGMPINFDGKSHLNVKIPRRKTETARAGEKVDRGKQFLLPHASQQFTI